MATTQPLPAIIGRGRVPSWQSGDRTPEDEMDSVRLAEEAEDELQKQLISIGEEMGTEDIQALKFLCIDHLPVSKLEGAVYAIDIFSLLKKVDLISILDLSFLMECLGRIHRFDLVKKAGFDPDTIRRGLPLMNNIQPFRLCLLELAEDMDDKDLQKLKFYLSNQIKKKKLSEVQTIMDLLILMEQEGIVSADKMDPMASMMRSIGRSDLARIVDEFLGIRQERPAPIFNRDQAPASQPAWNQRPSQMPPTVSRFNRGQEPGNVVLERQATQGRSGPAILPPRIDRSASAGTLSVSESESGTEDEATGNQAAIPDELFEQIAEALQTVFIDTGIELGFTNVQIDQYNMKYMDTLEKTKIMLRDWQAQKIEKSQIAPGIHQTLLKMGRKVQAERLMAWMESRYQGQTQQASPSVTVHPVARHPPFVRQQALAMQPPVVGPEINYTSSMNEAQPIPRPNFPPAGPPVNNYAPQVVNNCVSIREARANDPDRNIEHVENLLQGMALQGQTNQQQNVIQALQQFPADTGPPATDARPQFVYTGGEFPEYRMDRRPRGWCAIINNREFHVNDGDRDAKEMPPRMGTDKDAESLQYVFEKLGFVIQRRDNQSDVEILRYLTEISHNVDHRDFDCLVVCILTHGVENHIYGSNGKLVSIKDITSTFQANRCPQLAGKPKLFFIQACQGRNKMGGNDIERDAVSMNPRNDLETDNNKEMIPNEADFLIGYATVPGYVSFRSRNHGSWYIRKLCELLEKYSARHDLMSILVEVNREISQANANIDGGIFKQIPAPLVTLTKRLFFK